MLRNTYFGDLIVSPEELKLRHHQSIQPIQERWFEPVHQSTEAERMLRRMLGEPGSWNHLTEVGKRLQAAAKTILDFSNSADGFPAELVSKFIESCGVLADVLLNFHHILADGDLELVQQQLSDRQSLIGDEAKGNSAPPSETRSSNSPRCHECTV